MKDITRLMAIHGLAKTAASCSTCAATPAPAPVKQPVARKPKLSLKGSAPIKNPSGKAVFYRGRPRGQLKESSVRSYGETINSFIESYLVKAAAGDTAPADPSSVTPPAAAAPATPAAPAPVAKKPKKKRAALTPAQIEAEKQRRLRNAQKINKDNKWYNQALDGIANAGRWTGNAIAGGAKDLWDNGIANLNSGATSMVNGAIYGAADAVGFLGGLAGAGAGLANGLYQYATGNPNYEGFWGSLGKGIKGGWDTGWNVVDDHIGFGDYDLGHLKRFIQQDNINNREEYMKRNGIDPENATWLDKGGLLGLSVADAAGQGLGGVGGWAGTTKVLGTGGKLALKAVKPVWNAMSTAGRAAGTVEEAANAARAAAEGTAAMRTSRTVANAARGAETATSSSAGTAANAGRNAGRFSRMTAGTRDLAARGYNSAKPYLPKIGKGIVAGFTGLQGVMDNNDFNNWYGSRGVGIDDYSLLPMSDLSSKVSWG